MKQNKKIEIVLGVKYNIHNYIFDSIAWSKTWWILETICLLMIDNHWPSRGVASQLSRKSSQYKTTSEWRGRVDTPALPGHRPVCMGPLFAGTGGRDGWDSDTTWNYYHNVEQHYSVAFQTLPSRYVSLASDMYCHSTIV